VKIGKLVAVKMAEENIRQSKASKKPAADRETMSAKHDIDALRGGCSLACGASCSAAPSSP